MNDLDSSKIKEIKFQLENPSKEDLFNGSGHNHAAKGIKTVIEEKPEIKILGLEGELGAGKSTVIKILESQLDPDKYKFIIFDVDQYHHSSIKAAFVKVLAKHMLGIVSDDRKKDIEKAKNKALGNILSYTKSTDSKLNPYVFWFGFTFILTARYIDSALKAIGTSVLALLDSGNSSFSYDSAITIFLAISPLFVWFYMKAQHHRKNKREKGTCKNRLPTLGSILKRNTIDTISETLDVTREVSSVELKEAFDSFIDAIPDEMTIILVIDNLDRVEASKVREVWSDLEIFTSISNNNMRIILPFSESHVANALDESSGREYIAKRLPVVFRAPPIVSFGWREQFMRYWIETLSDEKNSDTCAELLEIWVSQEKQVTPRMLKKHVNDIACILISNSSNSFSKVACSAYILAVKNQSTRLEVFLSTNYESLDLDEKLLLKIKNTHKLLSKSLTEEEWTTEIASIHYQTSPEVAKSELLAEPIRLAVLNNDADRIIEISTIYGFDLFFERYIDSIGSIEPTKLAAKVSAIVSEQTRDWLEKWLPKINHIADKDGVIDEYDKGYVEAIISLKDAKYDVELERINSSISVLEELIKENEGDAEKLDELYSYCEVEGIMPQIIKKPPAKLFVDHLWDHRKKYADWSIESIHTDKRFTTEILDFALKIDSRPFLASLFTWLASSWKLGFDGISEDAETIIDFIPQVLSEYPFVVFDPTWPSSTNIQKLFNNLENSKEDEAYSGIWTALVFSHLISNEALNGNIVLTNLQNQQANVNAWQKIVPFLDEHSNYKDHLTDFLAFTPNLNVLLELLQHDNYRPYIEEPIRQLILDNRIQSLGVDSIITEHYESLAVIFPEDKLKLLGWLERWGSSVKTPYKKWTTDFVNDALDSDNAIFSEKLIDSVPPPENQQDFWQTEIDGPHENTKLIIEFLGKKSKKLKRHAELGKLLESCIRDKNEDLMKEYSNFEWINSLMDVLHKTTQEKVTRTLSNRLAEQSTSRVERYSMILNFGRWLSLPKPESKETREIYLSLIDGVSQIEVAKWLDNQEWHLSSWRQAELDNLNSTLSDEVSEEYGFPTLQEKLDKVLGISERKSKE